jgi:methyl-galactoside transport system ATP-binding protein
MRDGKWIATKPANELTTDIIIKLMVGRDLTHRFPEKTNVPGEVILKVENLTALYQPSIQDVSFDLRKGEILGLAGLVGSKRTDIVEALFGIRHIKSGAVQLKGKTVKNSEPRKAIKNGFSLVTEERRVTGIFGALNVNFNSVIANMGRYVGRFGLLNDSKSTEDTKWVIDSMSVKTPSQKTLINSLSGGNQQKVILGRWLLTEPEILMMDEPSWGLAPMLVHRLFETICRINQQGCTILLVEQHVQQALSISTRAYVLERGNVVMQGVGKELLKDQRLKESYLGI